MSLPPIEFTPALLEPAPHGLFPVVDWTDAADDEPLRWLAGVNFQVFNFGLGDAFEVWGHPYCATEDDLDPEADRKDTGVRPALPDTFEAVTVYAHDQCDLRRASQAEVRTRAQQVLRMQEQRQVERMLAARMDGDATAAGAVTSHANIVAAVGMLEARLAAVGVQGVLHASPMLAAAAVQSRVAVLSGARYRSPLGHTWVFGGGYTDGMSPAQLVATSPLHGWRDSPAVREVPAYEDNTFHVIAERSFVVGYEALVGAAGISG